jgi:ABC-type lipoprotein export system ATPase subunit
LSRALFGENEIILLDEPFSHQYHTVLDQFLEYIAGIKKDGICLVITHDPAVAVRADRMIDLNKTPPG